MKQLLFSSAIYLHCLGLCGQKYVGVGTTNPQSNLHIFGSGDVSAKVETSGDYNLAGIVLKTNNNVNDHLQLIKGASGATGTISGVPLANLSVVASGFGGGAFAMGSLGNYPFHIITNGFESIRINQTGYIGIGTFAPAFRLDVNGRVRIRDDGYETAGIWFNNSFNTNTAGFVGLYDDARIGLYGYGSGWSLLMNTSTGNVSMGPTTPGDSKLKIEQGTSSAALEISGAVKVSGSNAPAFKITTDSSNLYDETPSNVFKSVIINNALCNNDPNALLFVSPFNYVGDNLVSVSYDTNIQKWKITLITKETIVNTSGYTFHTCSGRDLYDPNVGLSRQSRFTAGEQFNVLIINR